MSKTELLSHQRFGVAGSNEGYIGQFLDFGDMIFSGFAASHDSNSECHLGAFGRAKSNSFAASRRLRGIPKTMAVSGPFGHFFSTCATRKPPVEITHQKSSPHDKHQGYRNSDVGRWDPVRRVAVCWTRAIQLTNERADTLGLEYRDYGQELHFRQAHNSMATTKQKEERIVSGTTWLVELALAASDGPTDWGNHWRSPI